MNIARLIEKQDHRNRKKVNQYFDEMRLARAEQRPSILEDAKKAVTRTATKQIARKMMGGKSARKTSERVQALPPQPLTPLASYNVWGATGVNGDGYALEIEGGGDSTPPGGMSESKKPKTDCKACGSRNCDCVTYDQMKEAMTRNEARNFYI